MISTSRPSGRRIGTMTVAATFALTGLVACASSGSAGSSNGSVRILNISTFSNPQFAAPQVKAAIRARVAEVDRAGGVAGHPLSVDFCDDQGNPNQAQACARKAVQGKYVAVVGGTTLYAADILPVLQKGGIPWIAGSGSSAPIEYQSAVSFPIQCGSLCAQLGAGRVLVDKNVKRIAVIVDNIPSVVQQADQEAKTISHMAPGLDVRTVSAPIGAADFSAVVASATQHGTTGVVLVTTENDSLKIVKELRQSGFTGEIGGTAAEFPPSNLSQLGPAANGLNVVYRMQPATATSGATQIADFLHGMSTTDSHALVDELAENAWTAIGFFADLVKGRHSVTAADVMSAAQHVTTPLDLGTVVPWVSPTSRPASNAIPRIERLGVIASVVQQGKIVPHGGFFNPLAPATVN